MAWNDGLTKEIDNFFNNVLGELGDAAIEIIKETVDDYSLELFKDLKKNTPIAKESKDSVNLPDRLTSRKITEKGSKYYGYSIYYEGEFKRGTKMIPYQKLANILNFGSVVAQKKKDGSYNKEYTNVKATRYISKAIKKLKKINPEINEKFRKKEKELMS